MVGRRKSQHQMQVSQNFVLRYIGQDFICQNSVITMKLLSGSNVRVTALPLYILKDNYEPTKIFCSKMVSIKIAKPF